MVADDAVPYTRQHVKLKYHRKVLREKAGIVIKSAIRRLAVIGAGDGDDHHETRKE